MIWTVGIPETSVDGGWAVNFYWRRSFLRFLGGEPPVRDCLAAAPAATEHHRRRGRLPLPSTHGGNGEEGSAGFFAAGIWRGALLVSTKPENTRNKTPPKNKNNDFFFLSAYQFPEISSAFHFIRFIIFHLPPKTTKKTSMQCSGRNRQLTNTDKTEGELPVSCSG